MINTLQTFSELLGIPFHLLWKDGCYLLSLTCISIAANEFAKKIKQTKESV